MVKYVFPTPSGSGPPGVFGRIVATLFFLGFFAMGCAFTYLVGRGVGGMLRTYAWERVPCRIVESRVAHKNDDKPFVFDVRYRYEVGAREHDGSTYKPTYAGSAQIGDAQRLVDRYPTGSEALCWVDPKDPRKSCLVRPSPWGAFVVLFPLVFVAVGAGGIYAIWASARAEKREKGRKAISKSAVSARKAAGCMAAFFGIFFVAGAGFSLFFVIPAIRVVTARSWRAVPCTVLSSGVRSHENDDGTTYSVDVLYEYEVGGRTYRSSRYHFLGGSSGGYGSKARVVAALPEGSACTCYVNPADPHDAVLKRSFGAEYAIVLFPLLFLAVGAGGIYFALRKARRIALAGSSGLAFFAEGPGPPGPVELRSPGPVAKFLVLTAVALFWNGIVGVFVSQMVKGWRSGDRPFGLTCFLVPFVAVGVVLVVATVSSFLATFNPRVAVTLSSGAIPLGGEASVEWRFRGAVSRLSRVAIVVEGHEEATYRRGSSTHTDRAIFARIPVFEGTGFGNLTAGNAKVSIPANAMHSFTAPNNKIVWTLKLRGEIPSWPDVTQDYALDVRPGPTGGRA